jgi:hypothetical protein
MLTYEEIAQAVQTLTINERKQLIALIVDSLVGPLSEEKTRNILEFEGIGEHLRDEEDAQEYVNRLRSEWDHRP